MSDKKIDYLPVSKSWSNNTVYSSTLTAAMSAVSQILGSFEDIDQFIIDQLGYSTKQELFDSLNAEQIDGTALALLQLEKRGMFICGDQTGLGKGRMCAAVIRYCILNSIPVVFVTKMPELFQDMFRDCTGIKLKNFRPYILSTKGNKKAVIKTGRTIYKAGGVFSKDYHNILFTNYSQFNSANTNKINLIKDYIGTDGVVILDEAHEASGPESKTGMVFRSIIKDCRFVYFLSATFSKTSTTLGIYLMRSKIFSIIDEDVLAKLVKAGGLAVNELITENLVANYEMIRREKSLKNKSIDYHTLTDTGIVEIMDKITNVIYNICLFSQRHINPIITSKRKSAIASGSKLFWTNPLQKAHTIISMALFCIKAPFLPGILIKDIQDGRKPIVTFRLTLQSLYDYLKIEPIDNIDLDNYDFKLVFKRLIDKLLDYYVGDPENDIPNKRHRINIDQLPVTAQQHYAHILEIANTDIGLTVFPLDLISIKLRQHGYSIGEITGRTTRVVSVLGKLAVKKIEPDHRSAIDRFNDGSLDALLLNTSGSTGISLHSSVEFKDQKQRHMYMCEVQNNIIEQTQLMGRVDRTKQISDPLFTHIGSLIPYENRILSVLKFKWKQMDAFTSGDRAHSENNVLVTDFLTKNGDLAAIEFLKAHEDINLQLFDPLKLKEGSKLSSNENSALRVSGRIGILPCNNQEALFSALMLETKKIEDEYGKNHTGAIYYDFNAESLHRIKLTAKKDELGIMGRPSYLHLSKMQALNTPVFASDILKKIKDFRSSYVQLFKIFLEQYKTYIKDEIDKVNNDFIEDEEKKAKILSLQNQELKIKQTIDRYSKIKGGVVYRIKIDKEEYFAILQNVSYTGSANDIPSLSRFVFRFVTTTQKKYHIINGSFTNILFAIAGTRYNIFNLAFSYTWDEQCHANMSSNRFIVVDNILSVYKHFSKGSIVFITMKGSNSWRKVILMPPKWSPKDSPFVINAIQNPIP